MFAGLAVASCRLGRDNGKLSMLLADADVMPLACLAERRPDSLAMDHDPGAAHLTAPCQLLMQSAVLAPQHRHVAVAVSMNASRLRVIYFSVLHCAYWAHCS
jgi:hypothetical protein